MLKQFKRTVVAILVIGIITSFMVSASVPFEDFWDFTDDNMTNIVVGGSVTKDVSIVNTGGRRGKALEFKANANALNDAGVSSVQIDPVGEAAKGDTVIIRMDVMVPTATSCGRVLVGYTTTGNYIGGLTIKDGGISYQDAVKASIKPGEWVTLAFKHNTATGRMDYYINHKHIDYWTVTPTDGSLKGSFRNFVWSSGADNFSNDKIYMDNIYISNDVNTLDKTDTDFNSYWDFNKEQDIANVENLSVGKNVSASLQFLGDDTALEMVASTGVKPDFATDNALSVTPYAPIPVGKVLYLKQDFLITTATTSAKIMSFDSLGNNYGGFVIENGKLRHQAFEYTMAEIEPGRWYTLGLKINTAANGRVDIYLNGKYIDYYGTYNGDVPFALDMVRTFIWSNAADNYANDKLYIDDLYITDKEETIYPKVTVVGAENSVIDNTGVFSVKSGENFSVTVTPNEGFYIDTIKNNGVTVVSGISEAKTYTFTVDRDTIIEVSILGNEVKPAQLNITEYPVKTTASEMLEKVPNYNELNIKGESLIFAKLKNVNGKEYGIAYSIDADFTNYTICPSLNGVDGIFGIYLCAEKEISGNYFVKTYVKDELGKVIFLGEPTKISFK